MQESLSGQLQALYMRLTRIGFGSEDMNELSGSASSASRSATGQYSDFLVYNSKTHL
jgi:hypothetical protein